MMGEETGERDPGRWFMTDVEIRGGERIDESSPDGHTGHGAMVYVRMGGIAIDFWLNEQLCREMAAALLVTGRVACRARGELREFVIPEGLRRMTSRDTGAMSVEDWFEWMGYNQHG